MQATERFLALVGGPAPEVPLDEAALLIAAHVEPLDVDPWLRVLDDIAASVPEASFDSLRRHLFEHLEFSGDVEGYGSPQNSLLHRVVQRRKGIPISLAVLMIAVGSRLDVAVQPIGMPGHFLVRDPVAGPYCDVFDGGELLDVAGCRAVYERVFGASRAFTEDLLVAVSSRAVLARILANLESGPLARDLTMLGPLLQLHIAIPGLAPGDRLALVPHLRRVGAFADALTIVEQVRDVVDERQADPLTREAAAIRARFN